MLIFLFFFVNQLFC